MDFLDASINDKTFTQIKDDVNIARVYERREIY